MVSTTPRWEGLIQRTRFIEDDEEGGLVPIYLQKIPDKIALDLQIVLELQDLGGEPL
jgi:hypothetical protein